MNTHYRGLAFLLSIGSMPLACNKDDNETDGGSTTAGTGPNATTGTGDDATDPTTGSSMSSTPTTDNSGTGGTTGGTTDASSTTGGTTGQVDTGDTEPQATTFLTSESDTDTGFETEDRPPPPPTDPTCIAYAAHFVECVPRYAMYQEYIAQNCEYYKGYALRSDGQACQDAFEAVFVCLSKVDCAEFMSEEGPAGACPAEFATLDEACPSFNEPPDSTTGGSDDGGGSETTGG